MIADVTLSVGLIMVMQGLFSYFKIVMSTQPRMELRAGTNKTEFLLMGIEVMTFMQ